MIRKLQPAASLACGTKSIGKASLLFIQGFGREDVADRQSYFLITYVIICRVSNM